MADDTNGENTEPQEPATGSDTSNDDAALGEAGRRALAAERDARKAAEKALRDAQTQIEASKAEATEWRQKAEAATADGLRWRTATKYGIAEEDAETFLIGTDADSLTKQAERLKALATPSGTPIPDPTQGARGESTGAKSSWSSVLSSLDAQRQT